MYFQIIELKVAPHVTMVVKIGTKEDYFLIG